MKLGAFTMLVTPHLVLTLSPDSALWAGAQLYPDSLEETVKWGIGGG